jgi:hypothetical protein
VYYPIVRERNVTQHKHLFIPFTRDKWNALREECQEYAEHDIFITCEMASWDISQLSKDDAAYIVSLFPDHVIRVLLYIRRLDDWVKSVYNQFCKTGINVPPNYNEELKQIVQDEHSPLYPSRIIGKLKELFGQDRVSVYLYDRKKMMDGDIVADVFHLMQKTIPHMAVKPKKINESIAPAALPYLCGDLFTFPKSRWWRLRSMISNVFSMPDSGNIPSNLEEIAAMEMEKLSQIVPGYKTLYKDKRLSLAYPEARVTDKNAVLIVALLYELLDTVYAMQDQLQRHIDQDKSQK